ncbi:MAG: putative zinc-binding protein [Gammaproteobacteria bacterium]|nr:putative zinc-binding protein [Gammaproteobacteria bacterium]MDH3466044.1 putative zinc-binding protein [Gammaproteobacteria bacterium]
MNHATPDFSVAVEGVTGACPAGEAYAQQNIRDKKVPVFSCEGPCIRGEIARLAANLVAQEEPSFARCCHAETFFVPHSSMARWVKQAEQAIMIDGCFLKCHGRILKNLIDEERIIHIDALPLYKKYSDVFLYTDVPQAERNEVARDVATKILERVRPQ